MSSFFSCWKSGTRVFWRLSRAVFGTQLLISNFTEDFFPFFFAVCFLYYNATLLRFLLSFNNIYFRVTCFAVTAVSSARSRHFRRARDNFFSERLIFKGFFVTSMASNALSAELNFLHFKKPNGCGRNRRHVAFLHRWSTLNALFRRGLFALCFLAPVLWFHDVIGSLSVSRSAAPDGRDYKTIRLNYLSDTYFK